ncbi:branched-chain amino acid ABC transporter permease [Halobellus sp. Atlit-38R]|uniref:branched-chain amino acid ABC transporter permease n=1 Tax=Halobellus sp. Atlit-38R TaxID=2282131 RepID=UPI000EF1AFD4|nr:branched-chain amino acid ABC transporter permease [Halobellus sp. Atlit-38R]RLM90329.1 branched-chain amino acid ABC transporter permease [Halobellus sp. Atlit-38R]
MGAFTPTALLSLPGWGSFLLTVLTIAGIYSLLTLGLNIHYGYTGLINFGHVAFFAAGAYTAALLTVPPPSQVSGAEYVFGLNLPMPLGLPVSLVAAAVVGGLLATLIGATSVRLGSHYLAVATFALAGIFGSVLENEAWLTNGSFGLNSVPKPGRAAMSADTWAVTYFVFVVVVLVAVAFVLSRLTGSPFGRLLKGVRESEDAAQMLGKNTIRVKLTSFAIGGAVAGLAGGLYAHYVGSVVVQQFVPAVTFTVWAALLLGGVASNTGAVFGAFLLVGFRESTRFLTNIYDSLLASLPTVAADALRLAVEPLPDHASFVPSLRFVVIGLLIVLVIRYRPEGVFGDSNEIDAIGEED